MSIRSEHPFADPPERRDPARRLRGRLGGVVTLWTATHEGRQAGLTVSSLMVAAGDPARVVALLDPDSDLYDVLLGSRRAVMQLLRWPHRDLADAFAGLTPAPGGPFRLARFEDTPAGPRLASAPTSADLRLEDTAVIGWSRLVTCLLEEVRLGEEDDPLVNRRGRYLPPG